jgi:hypothetical protein
MVCRQTILARLDARRPSLPQMSSWTSAHAQGYFSATFLMLVAFDGFTLSRFSEAMSLQIGLVGRDRFLIPLKTNARHVRNVKQSVTNIIRFLQDRIGPVLPF